LSAAHLIDTSACYRTQRALHSFPPRRSSDLAAPMPSPTGAFAWSMPTASNRIDRPSNKGTPSNQPARVWAIQRRGGKGGIGCMRSEEHTSELQSRENLVCRLLLEKKNEKGAR